MQYEWEPKKNEWLKKERHVSFEEIIFHLSQGNVWKIADHPNQDKYKGQQIYFVVMEGYVYLVPYVREGDTLFLKTIIPSRKATKAYEEEQ